MKLTYWEFLGILFISGLGIFLHYAYELFNNHQFIALIAPINETIWEHLKMIFYGMIGFALIEYIFIGNDNKNFIFAKAFSSVLACFLLVVLYYGYTSFLDAKLYLDIIIFVVAIIIAQLFSFAILKSKLFVRGLNFIGIILIFVVALLFASYTYEPPHNSEIFIELLKH
jgi:hypothetical protein